MSPKDAFKVGFLSRCVEEGRSIEEIPPLVKAALEKVAFLKDLLGGAKSLGSTALSVGAPMALAAPPLLGGVAGYTAAKLTDVDDTDVNEIKKRELIEELQRQTDRLTRERAIRDYRQQRQKTGRIFS